MITSALAGVAMIWIIAVSAHVAGLVTDMLAGMR